jgi:hypothetical protein
MTKKIAPRPMKKKEPEQSDLAGNPIVKQIVYDVILEPNSVSLVYKRIGFLPLVDIYGRSYTKH